MSSDDGVVERLERWRECLRLWLETGTATPSRAARQVLDQLLEDESAREWTEVARLGLRLREQGDAAALLDLLVWNGMLWRLHEAERLAG